MNNPGIVLTCLIALSACGQTAVPLPQSIPIQQVYAGVECGGSQVKPGIRLIRSSEQLGHLYKQLPLNAAVRSKLTKVDFNQSNLLKVNMGRQNTGGYWLKLASDHASINEDFLVIRVDWHTPPKGVMLTQALTSPCLFIKLPKAGFKGIRVLDQKDNDKLSARL